MQQRHLNTLEYPKILEKLAAYTMFAASKSLALSLMPSPYFSEVQTRQAETTEAYRLLSQKPNVGVGGARDVRSLAERTQRGSVLTPNELLEVRQTLIAARDLQRTLIRLEEHYPLLADMAARIEECPGVVHAIGQAIDERGEVKSSASPELAAIRRNLETAHGRLMEKLNRLVASSRSKQYLQEALVTQRQGRYVVPLKAEFKGKIQGIVHDQSASGATLFIEPLSTVEMNNKWRELQLAEQDEIRKILVGLSDIVSEQYRFIQHTVEALADLDLAFAKAKYAEAIDAVEPFIFSLAEPAQTQADDEAENGIQFKLMTARHPLLDPESVVPINVVLPEATRILTITGPNTGGKTVSLKTVGVLAAMAQAGLRIPVAEGSGLPVFSQIFADIGDEQSIEQNLSTFSGHMTNIVKILADSDKYSLVIFDELGAGTDPIEGSALARAILNHLLENEVTTFVATHYSELKAFAHTTPGVANASMEFDPETLSPTYRLQIGIPGASNAFAIAQRLGLSQEIINQAQGLIGENAQKVEAMLAEIRAQTEAAHQIRQQAEVERLEAEKHKNTLDERLKNIADERRDILSSVRADARREIKAVRQEIRELKEQAKQQIETQEAAYQKAVQETQSVVNEAMDDQKEVVVSDSFEVIDEKLEKVDTEVKSKAQPKPQPKPKRSGPVAPGDQVFIKQFNTVGEVVQVQNKQVEVQLGNFRASVSLDEVELRSKRAAKKSEPVTSKIKVPEVESPGMELDLRGQVVSDALSLLDQYLDQAFLARLPWVRVIHGKGSGTLRQVVRRELSGHPAVSSHRPGQSGEGGDGVTVAQLAVN